MDVLASIIIPVYNLERFVARSIESAINQSYINIEIVLVDDGSTDKSSKICDYYATIDNRVKVIHKANKGLVSSRKIGLKNSNGKYIIPLDADDWVEPDMLEHMISVMEEEDIDFAQSGIIWEYSNSDSKMADDILEEGRYNLREFENMLFGNLFVRNDDESRNGARLNICSCIFKRDLMIKSQNLIDDELANGEDDACFFVSMLLAKQFYKFRQTYYHAMVRSESMSRSKNMFSLKQVDLINNIVRPVLKTHKFCDRLEPLFNRYLLNLSNMYMKYSLGVGYDELYLLDFDFLKKDSRVIIYGAGRVGQSYRLLLANKCSVVAWIDEKKGHVYNRRIDKIDVVKIASYDYVIIAVASEFVAEEIRQNLEELGVQPGKIVWRKPKVCSCAYYVPDRT